MKKWVILFFFCFFVIGCMRENVVINFEGKNRSEIEDFANIHHINLKITEEYSNKEVGTILKQSPNSGSLGREIEVVISKGPNYQAYQVNELGDIPIMMYHGIRNMKDETTNYIGGNIDKDGYQRTSESFKRDLEFYYKEGYRMIRLNDLIEGKIDVELGKSPIVLTFDDGKYNIEATKNEKGEFVIDPECAVGILESFKKKYPDYQVTATFFLNEGLFESDYNEEILNWLVVHGYDIGNHSATHPDFSKITQSEASLEIGKMYAILDTYIPKKYVPIVALPFGSPYREDHSNFPHILNSSYEGINYHTNATLRVGWEANPSPFSKEFNVSFLKRIRAYDNDGKDFDIKMNFETLEKTKFVSDGNAEMITIPDDLKQNVGKTTLKVNTY